MTKNEKIAKAHYLDYLRSNSYNLWDVYGTYSRNKAMAFLNCRQKMLALDGWGLKILSHNSQAFTVGFEFADKETGVVRFAYITKDYVRYCDV